MQLRDHLPLSLLIAALLAACAPPSAQLQKTSDGDAGTIISFTDLRGTLKPCGCSPDLRKGGVDRIAHYILALQKRRSDLLILHAGNLILDDEGVPEKQRDQITLRTRHQHQVDI